MQYSTHGIQGCRFSAHVFFNEYSCSARCL